MIFLGYDQKFKGFKLYNPNKGKIMISKDAKFNIYKKRSMRLEGR